MASNVQIRSVPADVHRTLKARASQAGMSLSDFLLVELTALARRPSLEQLIERIESRPRVTRKLDSVRAIRAERGARLRSSSMHR